MKRLILCALLLGLAGCDGLVYNKHNQAGLIKDQVQAYQSAFNARDRDAIAVLWAEDAEYSNPATGERYLGREEIMAEFDAILKNAQGDIRIESNSVEIVSETLAVERGVAYLDDGATSYRALYVRETKEDPWLLGSVSEYSLGRKQEQSAELAELQWMIGQWTDAHEDIKVEFNNRWTDKKNFMRREITLFYNDETQIQTVQYVGWDPAQEQIRSWAFDSNGGFSEGSWQKRGAVWAITAATTFPDGRRASATHVIRPEGDDLYTWQSVNRQMDGSMLPNLPEVTVVRKDSGA